MKGEIKALKDKTTVKRKDKNRKPDTIDLKDLEILSEVSSCYHLPYKKL